MFATSIMNISEAEHCGKAVKILLVQEELYLLEIYRYIELNPVRAGMIADPGDYRWSSYQANGLERNFDLCTPHPVYLVLEMNSAERRKNDMVFIKDQMDWRPGCAYLSRHGYRSS